VLRWAPVSAISVLLPVRDAGPFLAPALATLWRQTLRDFEVIAVDDGSTDGSGERLDRAAAAEPRLSVIHTPRAGLPAALNTALAHARAPVVARHDADDLSHRDRFARQLDHLAAHPGTAAVGCRLRLFPSANVTDGMRRWARWHNALDTHEQMAREALIDSPLAHGTAMIRRAWLSRLGGWRELGWPEDLDLWLRMLARGARLGKCGATLYAWRQHAASATRRDPRYSPARFADLRIDALRRGFLARSRAVTLVGVGRTLEEWSSRLAALGIRVRAVEAARPRPDVVRGLAARLVLVFGAVPARSRWRRALLASGLVELRDFVFVA
jgi:glycosyltransferase involved in cell wall biosynthesis